MAPKFRGNSEDWLDDEEGGSSSSKPNKKKVAARETNLPQEEANATVEEVFSKQCRVKFDLDGRKMLCSYRWASIMNQSAKTIRDRTPVCVGDRVLAKVIGDQEGIIEGLCVRKNSLSRPAPGRDGLKLQHALAANLDLLVIVASVKQPEFSPGLIDRFLVAAEAEGIPTLICMTKIDLLKEDEDTVWGRYKDFGYSLVQISSKTLDGLSSLKLNIEGKLVAFCGQSGVGKTSLLRNLLGKSVGKVESVNESTGKGKHTTTGAVLLEGPGNSNWIDTPGVREFGLSKVTPKTLSNYFREFKNLPCHQKGCLHQGEVGCLAPDLYRYSSYLRIFKSLTAGEF